ncbi:jg25000 [Pararge aegeria aegeria]|uniref:Jg25000 protein n=1 Tax=Pararge aegeria aegeria TaxID=348720 RepID=A0A8S4QCX8_9NEOP|nr:jg25000 [Pararge aegeria aegeria]
MTSMSQQQQLSFQRGVNGLNRKHTGSSEKSYEGEICKDKRIPEINGTVQNKSHISENANLDYKISGDEKEEIRTDNDKDKCPKCTQYENNESFDEEEKRKHLIDKEESAERFKAHRSIHNKDNSVLCASFDLQNVLNTPHGENMMLYYSRKVAVYNLTGSATHSQKIMAPLANEI